MVGFPKLGHICGSYLEFGAWEWLEIAGERATTHERHFCTGVKKRQKAKLLSLPGSQRTQECGKKNYKKIWYERGRG